MLKPETVIDRLAAQVAEQAVRIAQLEALLMAQSPEEESAENVPE